MKRIFEDVTGVIALFIVYPICLLIVLGGWVAEIVKHEFKK